MSLVFIFPGQGSQSVGMLSEIAQSNSLIKDTFREASDALDLDLWSLVQNGPDEELNQTMITQPAMLAAGVAMWRSWNAAGGAQPMVMAGHSLGEYTALVCAGAIEFVDAVRLVAERGKLMQLASPEGVGAMAAILGLEDAKVVEVCQAAALGDVVSAVNFNSPGQVVIAGHRAAVERAAELAKQAGAKRAVMLPVSVPSHCELMQPAAEKLAVYMASVNIAAPVIPVINNASVAIETSADAIRDALVRQLYKPVRWVESVQRMKAMGVTTAIECGPGKVLTGLNKRIERDMIINPIYDSETLSLALSA